MFLFLFLINASLANVPFKFEAGQPAKASDVNQNFEFLFTQLTSQKQTLENSMSIFRLDLDSKIQANEVRISELDDDLSVVKSESLVLDQRLNASEAQLEKNTNEIQALMQAKSCNRYLESGASLESAITSLSALCANGFRIELGVGTFLIGGNLTIPHYAVFSGQGASLTHLELQGTIDMGISTTLKELTIDSKSSATVLSIHSLDVLVKNVTIAAGQANTAVSAQGEQIKFQGLKIQENPSVAMHFDDFSIAEISDSHLSAKTVLSTGHTKLRVNNSILVATRFAVSGYGNVKINNSDLSSEDTVISSMGTHFIQNSRLAAQRQVVDSNNQVTLIGNIIDRSSLGSPIACSGNVTDSMVPVSCGLH